MASFAQHHETGGEKSDLEPSFSAHLFQRAASMAHGLTDFDDLLRASLGSWLDVSGFTAGALFVPGERAELELRASHGFGASAPERLADLCGRLDLAERVQRAATPLSIDAELEPEFAELFAQTESRAILLAPIVDGRSSLGVLVGIGAQARSPEMLQRARSAARVVAQALELGRALSRLLASERRFRGIAESAPDGILVASRSHEISFANAAAGRVLGVEPQALVGKRVEQVVFSLTNSDEEPPSSDESAQFLRQAFEDPPGEVNVVYSLRALLERRRIDELAWLASHDPLTGLVNRRRFEEELELRMSESSRYGVQGALLSIDLDEFKPVNDTYGHAAGDRVLQTVSRVLTSVTRNTDVAARVGGDEFMVLLNHTDANGALACARKLLAHISGAPTEYDGAKLAVAASIGMAMFPRDASSPDALLLVADGALYAAKQAGRGRASFSPRSEADTSPPVSAPPATPARPENRASDFAVRAGVTLEELAAASERLARGGE